MIRKVNIIDLESILEIEEDLFNGESYSYKDLEYELNDNPYSNFFCLEIDGVIVAYIDIWKMFETSSIALFAVKKGFQNKGYGSSLLEYGINFCDNEKCDNISLEVRVSNEKAINLYKKYGFIIVNTRKDYYSDHEDAYLMVKPLGGNI